MNQPTSCVCWWHVRPRFCCLNFLMRNFRYCVPMPNCRSIVFTSLCIDGFYTVTGASRVQIVNVRQWRSLNEFFGRFYWVYICLHFDFAHLLCNNIYMRWWRAHTLLALTWKSAISIRGQRFTEFGKISNTHAADDLCIIIVHRIIWCLIIYD